jgi:predicted  nucleic acid-binding Zn-ribbon protein
MAKTKSPFPKSAVIGVVLTLSVFAIFNCVGGYDIIKSSLYTPSSEMSTIIDDLDLTDLGKRTLYASAPTLEEKTNFNEKCNSHNKELYVLGCYNKGEDHIYLYDIDDKELAGVKESTTAHELLHSVYARLPFWEQGSLKDELKSFYDTLPEDNELRKAMSLYDEKEFYDELHSRLGTEIKGLSEKLEKHYEKYFKNQDKIVEFYEKYNKKFKELEEELKTLTKNMEELKTFITSESDNLAKKTENLNAKILNYNSRVNSGNYSSYQAALNEGKQLQNEANEIDKSYKNLNAKISEYNNLVNKYNSNIIQTNRMMDSMNSNSEKIETVNK